MAYEIGNDSLEWFHLAPERVQSRCLVNPSVCITERLLLSQQGLYLVEFVAVVGNTCIL